MDIITNYLINNLDTRNLLILLIAATGIRIGEAVALKNEDISDKTISIRRTETREVINHKLYWKVRENPKTIAGIRTVVLPSTYEWLLKKIKLLNPFEEYVFMVDGVRVSTESIRCRWKNILEKINIPYRSPHKLRKTYVSILLDQKTDARFVLNQVGHVNINTSENNYHRNRRTIDSKQKILDDIPDFNRQFLAQRV